VQATIFVGGVMYGPEVFVPVAAILGFWAFMVVRSIFRARVRELEVRERIAMIERGLVPPPEVDPRGFERAMSHYDRYDRRRGPAAHRHRRAGVTLIGVGLGLMLMIGFAGDEPRSAIGVGGFLVALGVAFLINSLFEQRQLPTDSPPKPDGGTSPDPEPARRD
jgi:hypothetical protein